MSKKNNIAYSPAGKFEETRFEKIHNVIFEDSKQASIEVANEIASLIKIKASENKPCVLGLATGSTPIKVYEELIRLHNEEGLSFQNVISLRGPFYLTQRLVKTSVLLLYSFGKDFGKLCGKFLR